MCGNALVVSDSRIADKTAVDSYARRVWISQGHQGTVFSFELAPLYGRPTFEIEIKSLNSISQSDIEICPQWMFLYFSTGIFFFSHLPVKLTEIESLSLRT